MRKYLGIISIPIGFFITYWIFKSFIEGTETGAMPLFVIAYVITLVCWWFSHKGVWKTITAVIIIMIPAAFIIFSFSLIFTNFGT